MSPLSNINRMSPLSNINHNDQSRLMSSEDLCAYCHHQRVGHKNTLGDQDSTCSWPECTCKGFVE